MNQANNVTEALPGNPTVLVVDDEELMREVTCLMIEDNGGKTITAVDGADAVDVFRENSDRIDAILMDFSMPRMNGYEAYRHIQKISEQAKFIMISGLSITDEIRRLRDQGEVKFLAKPFGEEELLAVLKEVVSEELSEG